MKTTLIVSTYNSPIKLDNVLEHLKKGLNLADEIIISDDGSNKETFQVVNHWKRKLPLKHIWHEDKGFRKCKILNKSLRSVTGEYIIFLDGDCIPHQSFVRDHKKLAEKNYFIQGRRCFVPEEEVEDFLNKKITLMRLFYSGRLSGYFKSIRFPFPIIKVNQSQRGLIGCNWSAWFDDLVLINGFDEDYQGWGVGEDSDICTRLYNLGRKRKFVYGRAIVYHLNHPELPKLHHLDSVKKLEDVIRTRKIRCKTGLNTTLNEDDY